MKFSSKSEFKTRTKQQWSLLWQAASECPQDKSSQKALKQILAHLHAWHRLTLAWYKTGLTGQPALPADGFNWQQTRQLNAKLDSEFAHLALPSVIRRLKLSHRRVMRIVDELSERKLMKSGAFEWTGKDALLASDHCFLRLI